MSSIAVDLVDVDRRFLQPLRKPLTPRGRSRLRGHRRTRGHEVLEKRNGSPKHSGRRCAALARATICDLAAGVADYFEEKSDEDSGSPRLVIGYSRCAERQLRKRRRADLRELDEDELVLMRGLEIHLRDQARRDLVLLSDPKVREDQIKALAADSEIGDYSIASTVEEIMIATSKLYAA